MPQKVKKDIEFETRNTIYMDSALKKQIDDMADEKDWSFSHMSYVLLQSAIREKQRKKKTHTKHNTPDAYSDNAG